MPGGKRRLKMLMTTGLQVGSGSDSSFIKDILAGSVNITGPAFSGSTSGSVASVTGTIAGLTSSHTLLANVNAACTLSGCVVYAGACVNAANTANFYFAYIAASGGDAVTADSNVTMRYLALRT